VGRKGSVFQRIMILASVMAALVSGCAAPIKTTLSEVTSDPTRFRNKDVEVRGRVVRNVVQGDTYATWSLTLSSDGADVICHEEGWNVGVIRQAWDLAERARDEGEEVLVAGTLRVRHQEMAQGKRVDLASIAYKGQQLMTDYGDYPPLSWAAMHPYPLLLWPHMHRFYYPSPFLYNWYFPLHGPFYWHGLM